MRRSLATVALLGIAAALVLFPSREAQGQSPQALTPTYGRTAEWQWSVPAPTIPDRRAFLWIPPDCKRVRGLVVAVHNMIETALFERPAFREACAEEGIGILVIFSGHDSAPDDGSHPDHPKRSSLDIYLNPDHSGSEDPAGAGEDLQKVLDALAAESGHPELSHAPLMPVGHSSAAPFVWHLYRWDPSRIFAIMPFKTPVMPGPAQGIPILDINSEWFDYGSSTRNCSTKPSDLASLLSVRADGENSLFGCYIDVGSGHCNVSDDSLKIIDLFLKKSVEARIPKDAPLDAPVKLNPIATDSGWLLDPATLGKPEGHPLAYHDWKGDPKQAFWYLDPEMATAVQEHMVEQFAKKPQQLGFLVNAKPQTASGTFTFSPQFLSDGETFRVKAALIDHLDGSDLYPADQTLDTTPQPIYYRVNSGAVIQVGADTFRICPHGGPIVPQGNPWEPVLVAYTLGDDVTRPTERPAHVNIDILNTQGTPQTLDFPKIPDQRLSHLAPLRLIATASSGLPVQFFMISGPAIIQGNTLTFTTPPVNARLPMRVLVSAFQWGRSTEPKIRSAGPVTQEFFITK